MRIGGLALGAADITNSWLIANLFFVFDKKFHAADFFDRPVQTVAVVKLADPRRRAGGDQIPGTECQTACQKTDVLAQTADHVAGMRRHRLFAVLQNFNRKVLRLVDLVPCYDPRSERAEGVEPLANITRVVHALAPRIALADVPAHHVPEHVIERLRFRDLARPLADHRAKLALE